jgi:hypothetical protein
MSEKINQDIKNLGMQWKLHVPRLLNEIEHFAMQPAEMAALRRPFQSFRALLNDVAIRCSEINDPVLNALMCQMALYQIANPDDDGYDLQETKRVMMLAQSIITTINATGVE